MLYSPNNNNNNNKRSCTSLHLLLSRCLPPPQSALFRGYTSEHHSCTPEEVHRGGDTGMCMYMRVVILSPSQGAGPDAKESFTIGR